MEQPAERIQVFYDGACPRCRRDRRRYQALAGRRAEKVQWLDISGRDQELRELGIDPQRALHELHVRTADGRVLAELDAYIELMRDVPLLKPLARLLAQPRLRPYLARAYHRSVERRLRRSGRL